MTTIKITYQNDLRTTVVHENGSHLTTDGPKEVGGKGEYFSPTDLFTSSLASCMLTLMALAAKKIGLSLENTKATIEKEMSSSPPRRIAKLKVVIESNLSPTAEEKQKLEDAAIHCPVHLSIHPDIIQEITFKWKTT
jgi:uncharacterized OsmC-like protein